MPICDIKERKFYTFITKILLMSEDDAVRYIIESKISYQTLYEYIRVYLNYNLDDFSIEKLKEKKIFLEKVRNLYYDSIKGNTKEERLQKRVESKKEYNKKLNYNFYVKNRSLLEEYVDGEEYIYTILNKYRKSYSFFKNLIEGCSSSEKPYDKELYKQINKMLESKEQNVNQEIENIAPLLLGYINEGIKINNELLPFTMLDYYANFSLPFEYFFLYNGDKIQYSDLDAIKKFFLKNYSRLKKKDNFVERQMAPFNKEYELKSEYIYNVNGNEVRPSIEEREKVIDYLVDNDIPLDSGIYKQALRRYANGLLDINVKLKRNC